MTQPSSTEQHRRDKLSETKPLSAGRRAFLKNTGMYLGASFLLRPEDALWSGPGHRSTRLAVLGDSHLMPQSHNALFEQRLERAVAQINSLPRCDAVLFTGNLAHLGHAEAMARGAGILRRLRAPLITVPGVHDWYRDGGATYTHHFGDAHAAHEVGDTLIIALPSAHLCRRWVDSHASQKAVMQHAASVDDPRTPRFEVEQQDLRWLAAILAKQPYRRPIVIVSPTPLYDYYKPWNFFSQSAQQLKMMTDRFEQLTFVHGHTKHPVTFAVSPRIEHHGVPATGFVWPYPHTHKPGQLRANNTYFGLGIATLGQTKTGLWRFNNHMWPSNA